MSNTGVIREYYNDEKTLLKEEYFQVNGKKEGEFKCYYPSGELYHIINYVNDKKEGESKSFHENGQLASIFYYINNKKEGGINHIIFMDNYL